MVRPGAAILLLALVGCRKDEADGPVVVGAAPEAVLGDEAVVFVGTATTFDAGESVGSDFTWDFGDGQTGSGATTTHTYAAPGRYTVRLTAANDGGQTDIASTTRVAVYEPLATAPTSSGRLAYMDGRLYAVDPEDDAIVVIEDNEVVRYHPVAGQPVAVSAAAGKVAVTTREDRVEVFQADTGAVLAQFALRWGARPMGVVFDGDSVLIALAGTGEIVRMSLVDGEPLEYVGSVADPRALAVSEGVVYAPRFRSPDAGGVVTRIGDDTREFTLGLDPGPDSDTDARGLPTLLGAVAMRPDGRALVVGGSKANIARGLQRDGQAFTFETATRAALRSIDPDTGEQLERALFDNRDLVGAVAFTPLGDRLLVAHLGAGMVDVLDPFTLTRLGGFQSVGVGLDGIATDGETAWVLASVDHELVAYDLRAGNAEVELARVSLTAMPVDLGARVFHDAGDPRMSKDAYQSCASCHPDGDQDGRTWDFTDRGEGFRNTQALFAMPKGGPFHWSANFDEIQDFENAIRAHQSGTGFLPDEALTDPLGAPKAGLSPELDALAEYVKSRPTPRSPYRWDDGRFTEAAQRGREVFVDLECDTCHSGPETTDAAWDEGGAPVLHDIGTLLPTSGERAGEPLTGLRTPSLRALFATAPYLHDGRAPTLEDALTAHGVVPDADLVEYLLEIEDVP